MYTVSSSLLGIALQRGLLPWQVGVLPLGDQQAVILQQPRASSNVPVFSRWQTSRPWIFCEKKSSVMYSPSPSA